MPTANEDSSLGECANRRPLCVRADLCSQEMRCKHTQIPPPWTCDREGICARRVREGGRAVIAGFSRRAWGKQPRWHFTSRDASSAPGCQNISASFLAEPKQHCCASLLRCHGVSTFCTQTRWLRVARVGGWQEEVGAASCWKDCDWMMALQQKCQQQHAADLCCSQWES